MTAIIDTAKGLLKQPGKFPARLPEDIEGKVKRARQAMRKDAPTRRVCQKFWEGEHYWYVNSKNELKVLPSAVIDVTGGKPQHRIRNTYNFAASVIEAKVSAASQRVPGYEIEPSSTDPEDYAQAKLALQVANYGYDQWRLRRHTTKAITNALVQREGFVMPYFDPNVGPYTTDPDTGKVNGRGELRFLNLSRGQVGWEPGMDFEDSPFHIVERAVLIDEIKRLPGYVGGDLKPDAQTSDVPEGKRSDEMAVLTEFLERPCPDYPEGRRAFICNDRPVVDFRKSDDPEALVADYWWEPYPCRDQEDRVTDDLVIHRISYTVNTEGDDLGLMERLIDLSRTIDDCWNKLLEWKNRCLLPQMSAPRGANVTRRDDTPGATWYYTLVGGVKPDWETTPPVPRELFDMLGLAIEHLRALAADVDAQPEPDLAAKTLNAAIEQARVRWQAFLGDLAEFHSRLMRHCLMLVARHYDEPRVVAIRGQYGWEPSRTFTGQDLRSQENIRVRPGSLEAKGPQQAMMEIEFVQRNWPGAITPEAALAVMHGSPAEGLTKSYEQHTSRAWKVCMKLKEGPEAMVAFPDRFDAQLGIPVPWWMPRKVDNVAIWKQVVADFMCTDQYDQLPPETQHTFDLVFEGLEWQERQRALAIAMQQSDTAAQLGAVNAARPQGDAPLPQPRGLSPEQSRPDAVTPQQ